MKIADYAAVAAVLSLSACSSRPREFQPMLAAAPADQAAYQVAVDECALLLANGKLNNEGRLASGAAGVAAGGATMAAGAAAATSAGLYTGAAIASATIVAIPFVALAGAWGMSKAKRNKKEKAIKAAMSGCLNERGYQVASWSKPVKARKKPANPAKTAAE